MSYGHDFNPISLDEHTKTEEKLYQMLNMVESNVFLVSMDIQILKAKSAYSVDLLFQSPNIS